MSRDIQTQPVLIPVEKLTVTVLITDPEDNKVWAAFGPNETPNL